MNSAYQHHPSSPFHVVLPKVHELPAHSVLSSRGKERGVALLKVERPFVIFVLSRTLAIVDKLTRDLERK